MRGNLQQVDRCVRNAYRHIEKSDKSGKGPQHFEQEGMVIDARCTCDGSVQLKLAAKTSVLQDVVASNLNSLKMANSKQSHTALANHHLQQRCSDIGLHPNHQRILGGTPHWWGKLGIGSEGSTHTSLHS